MPRKPYTAHLEGLMQVIGPEAPAQISVPLEIARIIRNVFLPANPNKLRNAHPDTVAAAKAFIAAVEAASH